MAIKKLPESLVFLCDCLSPVSDQAVLPSSEEAITLASRIANRTFLTPALWCSIKRKGLEDKAPALFCEFLKTIYYLNKKRNEELYRQLLFTIQALNNKGIVPVAIKGAASIAENQHMGGTERIMYDLDLLVPPEKLDEGVRALLEAGYQNIGKYQWNPAVNHHFPPLFHPKWPTSIELHQWIMPRAFETILPSDELWSDLRPLKGLPQNLSALALSPTSNTIHSFAHSAIHHTFLYPECLFPRLDLKQLYNYSAFCHANEKSIDWKRVDLLSKNSKYGASFVTHHYLATRLFGIQTPLQFDNLDKLENKLLKTLWSVTKDEKDFSYLLRNAFNRVGRVYSQESIMKRFPGDERIKRLRFLLTLRLLKKYGVTGLVKKPFEPLH